jgi:hypothetical protein
VANVVMGARGEAQLRVNLDAVGWSLREDQIAFPDAVSRRWTPAYPYRLQTVSTSQPQADALVTRATTSAGSRSVAGRGKQRCATRS